jgi:glycosyltransferase involved in cell wall biosynthesis
MIKIITTCHNCEGYISSCIKSIQMQEERNWEMYIMDDASTDSSVKVASEFARRDSRIIITQNKKNKGAIFNKTINFASVAKPNDEDIIVTVDGDDYLKHPKTLSYLNTIYSKGYWLTYGGIDHTAQKTFPEDFYTEINWSVSLRNQRFCISHLRSHKFFLLKNIKTIDLKDKQKNFFKYGEDVTLFIPMAEMAGENRCFHIKDKLYYYRFHNDNIHQCSKNKERGKQIQGDLSFRVPYKRMKKKELINTKCNWL